MNSLLRYTARLAVAGLLASTWCPTTPATAAPAVQPTNIKVLPPDMASKLLVADLRLSTNTVKVLNPNPQACAADLKIFVENLGYKASTPCKLKLEVIDYHNSVALTKVVDVPAIGNKEGAWVAVSIAVGHPVEYAHVRCTVDSQSQVGEVLENNNQVTKQLFP